MANVYSAVGTAFFAAAKASEMAEGAASPETATEKEIGDLDDVLPPLLETSITNPVDFFSNPLGSK